MLIDKTYPIVYNNILTNDISKLPSFNADVTLSKTMDDLYYFTITTKRFNVDTNDYYIIEIEHFLKGISVSILKEQRYPKNIIDWFMDNFNLK